MLQLTINEKGGPSRTESFDKEEVTIGRVHGNDIILPKGNISKRHSKISLKDGKFVIFDLKSTNGTYVNGKKIAGPQVIKSTDKVYIGDFTLQIDYGQNGNAKVGLGSRSGDEVDLFGGNAAPFEPEPAQPSPGLLEDNFDNEFGASPADAPANLPRAATKGLEAPEQEHSSPLNVASIKPPTHTAEAAVAASPSLSGAKPAESLPKGAAEPPSPVALVPQPEAVVIAREQVPPRHSSLPYLSSTVVHSTAASPPIVEDEPQPLEELLIQLQQIVAESLQLKEQPVPILTDLQARVKETTEEALSRLTKALAPGQTSEKIVDAVVSRLVGIEPLIDFLVDDAVFEVVVTADRRILIDREGRLEDSGRSMGSDAEVIGAIHTLALMGGIEPGSLERVVDTRLRSGDRLMATLPPYAFRGPTLSVRKTTRDFFTIEKLQEYDTINGVMVPLLEEAIRCRQNILLSTGLGVSPTATLNALLSQMPADERIVTAESGVELHLRGHVHAVAFDMRKDIAIEEVLRHATVTQTERMIVAELTKANASPVVEALGTYLEGGAVSMPATSPEGAIERLTDWVRSDREETSLDTAKRMVAEAVGLVLQECRLSDGSRRIVQASELVVEGDNIKLETLCTFKPTGLDENRMVVGTFVPSGRVPSFLQQLVDRGELEMDLRVFQSE